MPLWVLEPKSDEKVPGTVYVARDTEVSAAKTAHLKTGTGRHEGIILVPQPSDSPNDPLSMAHPASLDLPFLTFPG
jgi:hypothetical protein